MTRFYSKKYGGFKFDKPPDDMIKEIETKLKRTQVSKQHFSEGKKKR